MAQFDQLLTWVTFVPLCTGVALVLLTGIARALGGDLQSQVWRGIGLGSALFTFLVSLLLWFSFQPDSPDAFQFVEYVPWIPQLGIHYFAGVDGISLLLILLTTFIMPVVLVSSWNDVHKSRRSYIFFMLFLETGMIGAFAALNLFQFYLFWEVMLIPMYFIIGVWGGPRRVYAAMKFFLFTLLGSLLMLVAILVVYHLHWQQTGILTLDIVSLPGTNAPSLLQTIIPVGSVPGLPWWQTQFVLFLAFALAFGIKVPMVPLHTWLPDAHVEAPTAGSVILAAVLLKMGGYGFLRFALPLFPVAAAELAPWVMSLALAGVLYGALVAMVQRDVKKLVAYSSVAHLGFVMLGMFALNPEGMEGSVLQMINHGITTGALFLLVGMLYERRHSRQIADFGGLAAPMPVCAAFFCITTMASIGLPLLNGFVGEFLILLGAFERHAGLAAAATFGVVLAAVYMLWMFRRVFFGPAASPENRALPDLNWRERGVLLAMVIPMFWIGVYPRPLQDRIEPPVAALVERVQNSAQAVSGPAAPGALQPADAAARVAREEAR